MASYLEAIFQRDRQSKERWEDMNRVFFPNFIKLACTLDSFIEKYLSQTVRLCKYHLVRDHSAGRNRLTYQLLGDGSSLAKRDGDLLYRPDSSLQVFYESGGIKI